MYDIPWDTDWFVWSQNTLYELSLMQGPLKIDRVSVSVRTTQIWIVFFVNLLRYKYFEELREFQSFLPVWTMWICCPDIQRGPD